MPDNIFLLDDLRHRGRAIAQEMGHSLGPIEREEPEAGALWSDQAFAFCEGCGLALVLDASPNPENPPIAGSVTKVACSPRAKPDWSDDPWPDAGKDPTPLDRPKQEGRQLPLYARMDDPELVRDGLRAWWTLKSRYDKFTGREIT